MFALILIFLPMSGAYADSHSLRYYTFGISAPGSNALDFYIVGYVDDQKIEFYSSDIGRRVPVAHWMKRNETAKYWERKTWDSKVYEALFRQEIVQWKRKFNHMEGFHSIQMKTGCELRDDGSTTSYRQLGYDGEEYLHYDLPTASFIPTMNEAETITQRWKTQDVGMWKRTEQCIKNECIERLKRFIEYGREDLERKIRPGVKVTGQESGEITKLHCLVYGFHPRAVDVKWMKNGVDDIPTYETTHVLPHPDGTYQIRVTAEVFTKDGGSYSCYVDHPSLEEPLLVEWELKLDFSLAMIIGAVVLIVCTSITAGIIICRRKKNDKAGSVLDTSSDFDKPECQFQMIRPEPTTDPTT